MKFRVFINFKNGILDPEAEAIKKSVNNLGFKNISRISKGKFFDIDIDEPNKSAQKVVEEISKDILSNPVIENYKINKIK